MGKTTRGFTVIELLIVLVIISLIIGIAIPAFRGMRQEAQINKVSTDLKALKLAVEAYYKNQGRYPAVSNYQDILLGTVPPVLTAKLYDPFGATPNTEYKYALGAGSGPTQDVYYIIYSVGIKGTGTASVDNSTGLVTASNEAIWISSGSQ
jgi:prepilin-type N-terminal cleavage/methylation domain-containing protein